MGNPWTPAPWHATTSGNYVMAGYAAGGYPIARMDDLEAPHSLREGNARLVAAAPEMAEVLECLARMAEHFPAERIYGTRPRSGAIYTVADVEHGEASITVEDLHRARAILARIRGETP